MPHSKLPFAPLASLLASALVVAFASTGCTVKSTNATGSDGGASPSDGVPTVAAGADAGSPPPSTCSDILVCSGNCKAGDDACTQACLDAGSDESRSRVGDLVVCYTQSGCESQEGDQCIVDNCAPQVEACMSQAASESGGTPSSQAPVVTGALPGELVGTWASIGLSSGSEFQFEADGKTMVLYSHELNYGCVSKITAASSGVSVTSGNQLLFHRETGTQTTKPCGSSETKATALAPADFTYSYALGTDGGEPALFLTLDGSTTTLRKK